MITGDLSSVDNKTKAASSENPSVRLRGIDVNLVHVPVMSLFLWEYSISVACNYRSVVSAEIKTRRSLKI